MAVMKCKMCGGDLVITEGASTAQCAFCGSVQTVPKTDDEKKLIQFDRAEFLRRRCEFDKAAGIYESIVSDFRHEAEAYWGLVLCKFGIEYVDDPATGRKIPTCHRSSFESVMDDTDLEQALENADPAARRVYREEAKAIEELRKGIIAVSANEQPYDIFICYKETDENGERTLDSVLGQDIYDMLTDKGYRVFFSRISLEDKLGVEYEPYIFAALHSASLMLAIGTDYEYYNAVWVKNEWSRFLKLMAKDKEKHLIPCYKGIDAYDMPKEFAKLQAQDLGKMGAMQDLLRGVEKLLHKEPAAKETAPAQAVATGSPSTQSYLKRAFMFLEDGDWSRADEFCETALNIDPENALAYLGKLMAELQVKKQEQLKDCPRPFDSSNNYQKALRFGDDALKVTLTGHIDHINTRNENARLEGIYSRATAIHGDGKKTEKDYKEAAALFASIRQYKDSENLEKACLVQAETARKDALLDCGISYMEKHKNVTGYKDAIRQFQKIPGWKDADARIAICEKEISLLHQQQQEAFLQEEKRKKRIVGTALIATAYAAAALLIVLAAIALVNNVIIPGSKYKDAMALKDRGNYAQAARQFAQLGDFRDAREQSLALWDQIADRETVSAGSYHTVGLREDGTVVAVGRNLYGQCMVSNWQNIVAISAGGGHTVGLRADGTVVTAGWNDYGQRNVGDWQNIVAISASTLHTVGLKADGTVVAAGVNSDGQCDVSDWQDIIAICAARQHTVGLKADGTVVVAGSDGAPWCAVGGWRDIVAISASTDHTVGLKADGTVVVAGDINYNQSDVSDWRDIVAIGTSFDNALGLNADGTVVVAGHGNYIQSDISDWRDIVAISASFDHALGLNADGTVVAVGNNDYNQCNVSDWQNIRLPNRPAQQ